MLSCKFPPQIPLRLKSFPQAPQYCCDPHGLTLRSKYAIQRQESRCKLDHERGERGIE